MVTEPYDLPEGPLPSVGFRRARARSFSLRIAMTDWLAAPWIQDTVRTLSERLPTLGIALGILIGGWLIAFILQSMIFAALQRTTIDDKIAKLVGMETGGEHGARIVRDRDIRRPLARRRALCREPVRHEVHRLGVPESGCRGRGAGVHRARATADGTPVAAAQPGALELGEFGKARPRDHRVAEHEGGADPDRVVDADRPCDRAAGKGAHHLRQPDDGE